MGAPSYVEVFLLSQGSGDVCL